MSDELHDSLAEIGYDDVWPTDTVIEGCKLICVCCACPEAYEVYYEDKEIGYLKLRHGNFRAYSDYLNNKIAWKASPKGNGMFTDEERYGYLYMAVLALLSEYRDKK